MLFGSEMFENIPVIFLLLTASLIPLWSEHELYDFNGFFKAQDVVCVD